MCVMIGAQNGDNEEYAGNHSFHFGIYPGPIRLSSMSKDLTLAETVLPGAQAPDTHLDSDLGGFLLLSPQLFSLFSYEITSDLVI